VTPPQASPSHDHRQDPFRWPRQDRARAHAAFADPFEPPASQRQYARENALPRATLGDWLRQGNPAGVEPALVAFFRSPAGERLLRRLVAALLVVFHHLHACGLRPLGLFLRLAGLDAFVAASYGALYDLDQAVQALLLDFERHERPRLADAMKHHLHRQAGPETTKAIVACPDENFHGDHPCLVAVEPVSDFLLVETCRESRDGATWTAVLRQATADLPVRVVLLCSDEAKGLLGCAQHGLAVPHAPDLFHQQRQLAGPILLPLARAVRQAGQQLEKAQSHSQRLEQAHDDAVPAEQRGQVVCLAWLGPLSEAVRQEMAAESQLQQAQQRHEQALEAVRAVGDAYHPFDEHTGVPLTADEVRTRLAEPVARLEQLAEQAGLGEKAFEALAKAPALLAALVGCVAWYWGAVRQRVDALALSAAAETAVYEHLLAGLYWQRQARCARSGEVRRQRQALAERLQEQAWQAGGALAALPAGQQEQVRAVAQECAGWLFRSSSCVEGRNSRLALFRHGQSRLSEQRLQVLGVVHNYLARREDGTTAAERFFGVKPGDAFAWLLERLPELPRPAAKRPKPQAKPASAPG
jgi:hypothetical protein